MVRVEFGKARCRFHGGPKTEAGRAKIAEAGETRVGHQLRSSRAFPEFGLHGYLSRTMCHHQTVAIAKIAMMIAMYVGNAG
jgi:hypothetical protein